VQSNPRDLRHVLPELVQKLFSHVLAPNYFCSHLAAQSTPGMSGPSQETFTQEVGDILSSVLFGAHTGSIRRKKKNKKKTKKKFSFMPLWEVIVRNHCNGFVSDNLKN
jgi:hypothetical protein